MHANLGYLLPTLATTVGRKVLPLIKDHLDQLGILISSIVSLESRDSTPEGCFDTAHLIETRLPISLGGQLEWSTIPELLGTPALWNVQHEFLVEYASISASLSLPSSPRFIGYHGWTADLQDWAGAAAMRTGLGAIKGFVPFRASRVEAVVAFQTDAQHSIYAKWFAPLPFTEALVTRALGERYPESVAKTLDFCAERGWWAAEEVTGPSLAERLTLKDCLDAISLFTRMQKELVGCHAIFAEMGLRDLRLAKIDLQIDATLAELEEVSALSSNEISGLSPLLSKATADLVELGFPETLIHGDLTPWNIKMSQQGPVFLDWEDAAWGPAIVSLEIFLAALRSPKRQLPDSGWLEHIRDFYLEGWGPVNPGWEDPQTRRHSRALALFCQLRGYLRCWRDEPDICRGRRGAAEAAQKLDRVLRNACPMEM
jgi:Phosphotransferase enzyme family